MVSVFSQETRHSSSSPCSRWWTVGEGRRRGVGHFRRGPGPTSPGTTPTRVRRTGHIPSTVVPSLGNGSTFTVKWRELTIKGDTCTYTSLTHLTLSPQVQEKGHYIFKSPFLRPEVLVSGLGDIIDGASGVVDRRRLSLVSE